MLQGSESCASTVLLRLHMVISIGRPSRVSMHDMVFCLVPPLQGAEHSPLGPSSNRYLASEPATCTSYITIWRAFSPGTSSHLGGLTQHKEAFERGGVTGIPCHSACHRCC